MGADTKTIAAALRRRDAQFLGQLVEEHQHRLLRYLLSLTREVPLAEDVFQETWLRVLERGRQYDGRHAFSTWLFAIARHLLVDRLRRRSPLLFADLQPAESASSGFDVPDPDPRSPFDEALRQEQQQALGSALDRLPGHYREVLLLRFREELSLDEIATVTASPLSTVKARLYRGLSHLRRRVEKTNP